VASGDKTNGGGAKGRSQRMSALLIQALNHPLRRKLLRALHSSDDARSPVQLSKMTGEDLSSIDYHIKILVSMGAAVKTGDRQVRGARENFFLSKVSDHKQMVTILADTERDDCRDARADSAGG
jgi:DNA-binding transcriptional ArsR family regulator